MNEIQLFDSFCLQYNNQTENINWRNKIKEYLQIKILEYIASQSYSDKFTLVGWSALRLFYDSNRLSDDLDFNTNGITQEEFSFICKDIKHFLLSHGHKVRIIFSNSNFYHCMFVITSTIFSEWKYIEKISNLNLKIKVDAAEDNWDYPTEYFLPKKTINNIYIKTTYADVLLSKKIIAFYLEYMMKV